MPCKSVIVRLDIPYHKGISIDQAEMHAKEMEQSGKEEVYYEPVVVHKLWNNFETIRVPMARAGHGGGDKRLHEKLFKNPDMADPYGRSAGLRDGAMSILIGIAARKSIESGEPVNIAELTDLEPRVTRI